MQIIITQMHIFKKILLLLLHFAQMIFLHFSIYFWHFFIFQRLDRMCFLACLLLWYYFLLWPDYMQCTYFVIFYLLRYIGSRYENLQNAFIRYGLWMVINISAQCSEIGILYKCIHTFRLKINFKCITYTCSA